LLCSALRALAALPRLHGTLCESFRAVGQRQVVINADDAAKSTAGGTCAYGIIEGEESWRRFAVFEVASGAMEAVGKGMGDSSSLIRRSDLADGELAFTEVIGLFAGFGETRA